MKEETARTVANVVLAAAAIGVAVVVLRVPTLRRMALAYARTTLLTAIPAWFANEVHQAWEESAQPKAAPSLSARPELGM